ncbi:hypothetical protein HXA31_20600 [Salipaludibacillus agaradhaerens]|uniref:Uncharacterized protein n=1 Tax=Salipaludibacillus agaradhaerens TaxID=76935 RepID=A0A9Q4FZM4_SALAG|nr:hypothetical protein [Salipaludibacillus agaradhaerens]MCR6096889.1 hypothetical protein [Salipaludibacillus agaradhaerens]MCR6116733.1 hypothetical protein [Salipaludibacillus agaradhaerens]
MKNVGCYLVTKGKFEQSVLPEKLLLQLVKHLREKGKETVHFSDYSIEVEGIYIPAKGSETKLMCLGDAE